MSHALPRTIDEITAVYANGPPAVVDLVQQLPRQVAAQQQTIADCAAQLRQLQERLDRNSHNSNQPSSTEGFTAHLGPCVGPVANRPAASLGSRNRYSVAILLCPPWKAEWLRERTNGH